MKLKIKKNLIYNFLMIFYFFGLDYLYLCFPFLNYIINSKIVGTIIICVLLINLYKKKSAISYKVIWLYICYFLVIFFSYFSGTEISRDYISNNLLTLNNIKYILLYPLFLITIGDLDEYNQHFVIISRFFAIYLTLVCLLEMSSVADFYSTYGMWFGFVAMYFWIGILQNLFIKKNFFDAVIIVAFGIFVISSSSRSVILVMGFAIIAMVINYFGTTLRKKIGAVVSLGIIGISIYTFFDRIIDLLIRVLSNFNNLGRTLYYLKTNIGDMDGRDFIWGICFDELISNPFKIRGIAGEVPVLYKNLGIAYGAHNIFFELLLDFGVLIGGLLLILFICIGIKGIFLIKDEKQKRLMLPIAVPTYIILFFSQSIFTLPWAFGFIVVYLQYRYSKKYRMMDI